MDPATAKRMQQYLPIFNKLRPIPNAASNVLLELVQGAYDKKNTDAKRNAFARLAQELNGVLEMAYNANNKVTDMDNWSDTLQYIKNGRYKGLVGLNPVLAQYITQPMEKAFQIFSDWAIAVWEAKKPGSSAPPPSSSSGFKWPVGLTAVNTTTLHNMEDRAARSTDWEKLLEYFKKVARARSIKGLEKLEKVQLQFQGKPVTDKMNALYHEVFRVAYIELEGGNEKYSDDDDQESDGEMEETVPELKGKAAKEVWKRRCSSNRAKRCSARRGNCLIGLQSGAKLFLHRTKLGKSLAKIV